MSQRLWEHGEQYAGDALDPATAPADPFVLFERWFAEAVAAKAPSVNAMTLATSDEAGRPSARIVLLKEVEGGGFVFYTNYESRKGHELDARPWAALLFYWQVFDRQVRIEGRVERVDAAMSDAYFASRPRGSQLGAIVSPQSRVLTSRAELEAQVSALDAELADAAPSRPASWGGYRVIPSTIEFWQGQPSRLHDRVLYGAAAAGWQRSRLAP